MLTWHIEHGGKTVPLERIDVIEIREQIDPIRRELEFLLSTFEAEANKLQIVFVVDEDGQLSIALRGSPLMVNQARDKIGDKRHIGWRLS